LDTFELDLDVYPIPGLAVWIVDAYVGAAASAQIIVLAPQLQLHH